jgi:hypothetical protein
MRLRVQFPASRRKTVFGEDAEHQTRGRVCSPEARMLPEARNECRGTTSMTNRPEPTPSTLI